MTKLCRIIILSTGEGIPQSWKTISIIQQIRTNVTDIMDGKEIIVFSTCMLQYDTVVTPCSVSPVFRVSYVSSVLIV